MKIFQWIQWWIWKAFQVVRSSYSVLHYLSNQIWFQFLVMLFLLQQLWWIERDHFLKCLSKRLDIFFWILVIFCFYSRFLNQIQNESLVLHLQSYQCLFFFQISHVFHNSKSCILIGCKHFFCNQRHHSPESLL